MDAGNKIIINQGYSDINPRECGWEACAPSHAFGPAIRPYWLLHFVVSGRGVFLSPRGRFEPRRNDMFVIRPYEITCYEADPDDPWTYIWIGFEAAPRLPTYLLSEDLLCVPFLGPLFRACTEAPDLSEGGQGYEAFLCSRIWELFSLLAQRRAQDTRAAERYIRPALSIMETEFCNGITVADIAQRLHLNRSYFSELFRACVKKTPARYLTELRMERAAMLLARYGYNVTVTAASVGYPDLFAFSRAFRRYFGISPSEYSRRSAGHV